MALLTKTDAPGAYVSALTQLRMTAATVSGDEFTLTTNDILVVHNTDASAHNITITSVASADLGNRSGDITNHSVDAGEIHIWGPARLNGWRNSNGRLAVTAEDTSIELGIITQE